MQYVVVGQDEGQDEGKLQPPTGKQDGAAPEIRARDLIVPGIGAMTLGAFAYSWDQRMWQGVAGAVVGLFLGRFIAERMG